MRIQLLYLALCGSFFLLMSGACTKQNTSDQGSKQGAETQKLFEKTGKKTDEGLEKTGEQLETGIQKIDEKLKNINQVSESKP